MSSFASPQVANTFVQHPFQGLDPFTNCTGRQSHQPAVENSPVPAPPRGSSSARLLISSMHPIPYKPLNLFRPNHQACRPVSNLNPSTNVKSAHSPVVVVKLLGHARHPLPKSRIPNRMIVVIISVMRWECVESEAWQQARSIPLISLSIRSVARIAASKQ
ncbi:hypothetical protein BJ508DRAFT_414441 [Ascobolus immersus RN42]|uniref:Uncharacterized protein n=1 Tax=Ascobolus immersus RN42 TaxID=1160509 RepID=A0A3N4I798_ASCIM|nr:hypothetical protein BJ508DRAFT_414441 [Ascobolus immersus RN42]